MIPKGKLLIIGGAEDKGDDNVPRIEDKIGDFEHFEILRELLPVGRYHHRIEVITTASRIPDEMRKIYKSAFKKIGYTNIGFMDIADKMEAREKEYTERIKEADAVFFSGGDQFRISTIIGGTSIEKVIREKYMKDSNFIVAGTSSGAMVLAKIMIYEGENSEALVDRDIKTTSGLGLLENCIVDTHFIKRGRFGRLAHAVTINPGHLGIGLGEDAAMIVRNGSDAECRGSGMVVIIDGSEIRQTNISEAEKGCLVFVENLRVHLLVKYCRFSLKNWSFEVPAIKPSRQKKRTSHRYHHVH